MHAHPRYEACLDAMYGLRRFGIKLELTTIKALLEGLDNPHLRFAAVHIAGTNGKGSVAATLSRILTVAGFRTGTYTSPHLIRFNERIAINGAPVSDTDIVNAYDAVATRDAGDRSPTFFELATAMACHLFAEKGVEIAVIETGMGGRLDATNIITPLLSIITTLSREHTAYLGNDINSIAREKGGIIKPGIPVLTGVRQSEPLQVLSDIARDRNAPFIRQGSDFRIRRKTNNMFTFYGRQCTLNDITIRLRGRHQQDNAALALAACEILNQVGGDLFQSRPITETSMREGIRTTQWAGRLDVVSTKPYILVDGAHNPFAARTLSLFLKAEFPDPQKCLVIGMLDDKSFIAILKKLVPLFDRVILTQARTDRGIPVDKLEPIARSLCHAVSTCDTVKAALDHAITHRRHPNEVICVTGSLHVVGEALEALPSLLNSGEKA
ncbi:MAG: bifunctional tetrahydrofolate synthase/dihydrofolate synthase [Deltaproteobacteria bacterium]|nr:MAG: bifunctional tetrahydrofolate synthase/dihydrofolate synthase [Deltaproteobacteria bacterium]